MSGTLTSMTAAQVFGLPSLDPNRTTTVLFHGIDIGIVTVQTESWLSRTTQSPMLWTRSEPIVAPAPKTAALPRRPPIFLAHSLCCISSVFKIVSKKPKEKLQGKIQNLPLGALDSRDDWDLERLVKFRKRSRLDLRSRSVHPRTLIVCHHVATAPLLMQIELDRGRRCGCYQLCVPVRPTQVLDRNSRVKRLPPTYLSRRNSSSVLAVLSERFILAWSGMARGFQGIQDGKKQFFVFGNSRGF